MAAPRRYLAAAARRVWPRLASALAAQCYASPLAVPPLAVPVPSLPLPLAARGRTSLLLSQRMAPPRHPSRHIAPPTAAPRLPPT